MLCAAMEEQVVQLPPKALADSFWALARLRHPPSTMWQVLAAEQASCREHFLW
jgi:hypothetical protein